MIKILCKDFIKSLENTYENNTYFTVVGWDIELENLYEECKIKHIPTESNIYPVCVYRGIHIKGLYFHKDYLNDLKSIISKGYGRLVINGKSPFN